MWVCSHLLARKQAYLKIWFDVCVALKATELPRRCPSGLLAQPRIKRREIAQEKSNCFPHHGFPTYFALRAI